MYNLTTIKTMNTCFSLAIFLKFLQFSNGFLFPNNGIQAVQTKYGEIHGLLKTVSFNNNTYTVKKFLSIPYAEPPIGQFRFRKPSPLLVFPSPYDATFHRPICPQEGYGMAPMSEDCLFLDVIVPSSPNQDNTKRHVMVWIHGGAFISGSGNGFDVDIFSAYTDVIVVKINYRLGALGFFTTDDLEAAGNYGLWDQKQAFMWIQENIESFGGDPNNVTIFGESAGSSSAIFQATNPGNRGLFKRVIAESGTLASWAIIPNNGVYNTSMRFAKSAGCPTDTHQDLMDCLRDKPKDDLVPIVSKYAELGFPSLKWGPVYDRDFVLGNPSEMFTDNKRNSRSLDFFKDIDLMIGWNSYDGLAFIYYWTKLFNITSVRDFTVTKNQFDDYYLPYIIETAVYTSPTDLTKAAVKQEYVDFNDPDNNNKLMKSVADMSTDALFVGPAVLSASAHLNNNSNTFVYRFAAKPPTAYGNLPPIFDGPEDANHAEELVYVFGSDDLLTRYIKDQDMRPEVTELQRSLSKVMMKMWSNFAKTGNPNLPFNLKSIYDVEWRPFTADNPDYINLTVNMTQQSMASCNYLRSMDFWNVILPKLLKRS